MAYSVPLQIFVEIERARLTRRLAAIREAEGNIADAADTMQEVPVVSVGLSRQGLRLLINFSKEFPLLNPIIPPFNVFMPDPDLQPRHAL